ncbi:MAG: hypothetical protein PHN80_04830 [Hespellia sp.]|nr:hypothetical protein [Hespellia sp.]
MMSTQIKDSIGRQQLTLNIRTMFDKAQEKLFPQYEKQIQLLKNVKGSIATYINDYDCAQVYQYYAVSPNYLLEARMLRRMDIAVSVVCVRETIEEYLNKPMMPKVMKSVLHYYILQFLNAMDYIVVTNKKNIEFLKEEGVVQPQICYIDDSDERQEANQWLQFYYKVSLSET